MSIVQQISLEEEYKKDTGISPEDIRDLRQWLKTQPHLPEEYITDLDLILAYHSCSKSSGVTKQVIDLHYTLRTLFTNLFQDRTVESIEAICNAMLLTLLPMRTEEGDAVFYVNLLKYDPKVFQHKDCVKAVLMLIDLYQYEEGTWPGFHLVIDFKGACLGHLARVELQTLQQFLYYLQETMLVKVKALHLMNAPSWIDKVLMLIKPFLKKELLERQYVHTAGSDSFERHIPIAVLPKDCGGSYKTSSECRDDILNKLRANKDFFKNESKKRVVESLRPGRPKTISDVFGGIEGSFKKLDID